MIFLLFRHLKNFRSRTESQGWQIFTPEKSNPINIIPGSHLPFKDLASIKDDDMRSAGMF
jgi:hypothetical protein